MDGDLLKWAHTNGSSTPGHIQHQSLYPSGIGGQSPFDCLILLNFSVIRFWKKVAQLFRKVAQKVATAGFLNHHFELKPAAAEKYVLKNPKQFGLLFRTIFLVLPH